MAKTMDRAEFERMDAFGIGGDNPAQQYFQGKTYLKVLTDEGCAAACYNVTFTPGCRNNWHGAKADSWFSHIGVEVPGENASNERLEPVTDEEYAALA